MYPIGALEGATADLPSNRDEDENEQMLEFRKCVGGNLGWQQ